MSAELGKASKKMIDDGNQWDEDRLLSLRRWVKIGWILAGLFLILFLIASTTGLIVWAKMAAPVAPNILAVDHATGDVQVLELFNEKAIGNMPLTHKLFAKTYVETCERYIPEQLNNDFAACADMSEGKALDAYSYLFKGDDARNVKLKNSQIWTVKVLSVQLPSDAAGIAIVRFRKTIWIGGSPSAEGVFVARLTYRFADVPRGTEREKMSNPFSYKVRFYQADPEIGALALPGVAPADGTIGKDGMMPIKPATTPEGTPVAPVVPTAPIGPITPSSGSAAPAPSSDLKTSPSIGYTPPAGAYTPIGSK
jgi:type IV secretory pathway component VirB8